MCKQYNGWKNYETWAVARWLDNEQGSNEWLIGLANSTKSDYEKSQQLKETIEKLNPLADDASMFSDLLNAAISGVDWYGIIENHQEEQEEEEELEEEVNVRSQEAEVA